jgi:maleate isomerase
MQEGIFMDKSWRMSKQLQELPLRLDETLHLGVLVPWANQAMEAELPLLFPQRVVWHIARLVPSSTTTALDDDFLTGMVQAIPQAVFQLSRLPLRTLAFGCTSASSVFSDDIVGALQVLQRDQHAVPFLTAFSALCLLLAMCQAKRIVLVAPYEHELTLREAQVFEHHGIVVQRAASLGYRDDIGSISSQQILDACATCPLDKVDALVISCTALHTLDVIPLLEEQYHLPVLSSNTALALASVLVAIHQLSLSLENQL